MRGVMRNLTLRIVLLCSVLLVMSSCRSLIGSITEGFSADLSAAILNNPDLEMVRDGAPSYLILIDSLLAGSPHNAALLKQSATLHSAYASAFVDDRQRAKLLHNKAKQQALGAICHAVSNACDLDTMPYKNFSRRVQGSKGGDVPYMYTLAMVWASWIQANSDDFTAIAELARVKALMTKVAELDPEYEDGAVFLYLGVFETLLPRAMGGRPELGRAHFERAIELSAGANLLAKVTYAQQYARLVFDRELHDRLLNEVLAADVSAAGLTLMNTVAQNQAMDLLNSADEYF